VRTHAEHLARTLNPVPLFVRVGHCVPVGTDDRIHKSAYTRGLDVKKHINAYSIILDIKELKFFFGNSLMGYINSISTLWKFCAGNSLFSIPLFCFCLVPFRPVNLLHTYLHTYIHSYIFTYIHTYLHTYTYIFTYIHT